MKKGSLGLSLETIIALIVVALALAFFAFIVGPLIWNLFTG
jgi:hypothetical protein